MSCPSALATAHVGGRPSSPLDAPPAPRSHYQTLCPAPHTHIYAHGNAGNAPERELDFARGTPAAVAMHHQRQTFDRKTRSSTTKNAETHVGIPRALMEENPLLQQIHSTPCPFTAQTRVTTTTTITTVVTTNTSAHPGDVELGIQPWLSTNTQTDVHEDTTIAQNSELVALRNPNAMQVEAAVALPAAPLNHAVPTPNATNMHRRNGRRKSLDMTASPILPIRRSRRTSSPAPPDSSHQPKPVLTAKVTSLVDNGSENQQQRYTPAVLLHMSRIPRPSDLVIVRLVDGETNEVFEASGEFLCALDPKRASIGTGELLISPVAVPTHLSHVNLEECRLSFSWLSGERIVTSCVTMPLGSVTETSVARDSTQPPVLKRPKLE